MKRIFHPFRRASGQLGPLEQRMLDALWARGNATVRELVEDALPGPGLHHGDDHAGSAFQEGSSEAEEEGRAFRYAPRLAVRSCIAKLQVMPSSNCWMRVQPPPCRCRFWWKF